MENIVQNSFNSSQIPSYSKKDFIWNLVQFLKQWALNKHSYNIICYKESIGFIC